MNLKLNAHDQIAENVSILDSRKPWRTCMPHLSPHRMFDAKHLKRWFHRHVAFVFCNWRPILSLFLCFLKFDRKHSLVDQLSPATPWLGLEHEFMIGKTSNNQCMQTWEFVFMYYAEREYAQNWSVSQVLLVLFQPKKGQWEMSLFHLIHFKNTHQCASCRSFWISYRPCFSISLCNWNKSRWLIVCVVDLWVEIIISKEFRWM